MLAGWQSAISGSNARMSMWIHASYGDSGRVSSGWSCEGIGSAMRKSGTTRWHVSRHVPKLAWCSRVPCGRVAVAHAGLPSGQLASVIESLILIRELMFDLTPTEITGKIMSLNAYNFISRHIGSMDKK